MIIIASLPPPSLKQRLISVFQALKTARDMYIIKRLAKAGRLRGTNHIVLRAVRKDA